MHCPSPVKKTDEAPTSEHLEVLGGTVTRLVTLVSAITADLNACKEENVSLKRKIEALYEENKSLKGYTEVCFAQTEENVTKKLRAYHKRVGEEFLRHVDAIKEAYTVARQNEKSLEEIKLKLEERDTKRDQDNVVRSLWVENPSLDIFKPETWFNPSGLIDYDHQWDFF